MSNLGYACGLDGSLGHYMRYAYRYVYCPPKVQQKILNQVSRIIMLEDPDVCCFVEIDKGSFASANLNQLEVLLGDHYRHYDIENKYGEASRFRTLSVTQGRSNGFMSKHRLEYERVLFTHGVKRLIYKVRLRQDVTLYFAHFSLKRAVRKQQLLQVDRLIEETPGEVIFMGDFNVLTGLGELDPLLEGKTMVLMNRPEEYTFTFHRRRLVLDLCLCTPQLATQAELRVVPQPYSDHHALLLTLPD